MFPQRTLEEEEEEKEVVAYYRVRQNCPLGTSIYFQTRSSAEFLITKRTFSNLPVDYPLAICLQTN